MNRIFGERIHFVQNEMYAKASNNLVNAERHIIIENALVNGSNKRRR